MLFFGRINIIDMVIINKKTSITDFMAQFHELLGKDKVISIYQGF